MTILKSKAAVAASRRENIKTREQRGGRWPSLFPFSRCGRWRIRRGWPGASIESLNGTKLPGSQTGRSGKCRERLGIQFLGRDFPRSVLLNGRDSVFLVIGIMTRMRCMILVTGCLLSGVVFGRESADINLNYVEKQAELRAHKPFRSPRADLPDFLRADKLDYDKYREIEFRHEKALWAAEDLPFRVEFFHPGYLYEEPVHVNEFTLTAVQAVRFMQDSFNYRNLQIEKRIPANTGYAGFRLLHELNESNKWDELGAFQGASYFR